MFSCGLRALQYTIYLDLGQNACIYFFHSSDSDQSKSILYTAAPNPMPIVLLHKNGQVYRDEVKPQTNLVVRAGIKQFPYPNLNYQCGMGKCATCACRVLAGGEHLAPPNWKEKKQLADRLDQ